MRIASLTREQFLDWLSNRDEPRSEQLTERRLKLPPTKEVSLVWSDSSNFQNPIIVIANSDLQDFFAFVSTYVSIFKPFSAYFNVVPFEHLKAVISQESLEAGLREQYSKLIGVALAEAYIQSRGRIQSLEDLSVQGVQATLSATLMSAVWRGFGSRELTQVADRWAKSRSIVAGAPLAISPDSVLEVWTRVFFAIQRNDQKQKKRENDQIALFLQAAFSSKDSFEEHFIRIVGKCLGSDEPFAVLKGAREDRIRALPEIITMIHKSKASRVTKELVAGGLLSMVSNGSMSQIKLMEELGNELSASALWFGVVSAFQSKSDAVTASNCLGRRALRELLRPMTPFDLPMHDISFEELSALGKRVLQSDAIRLGHSGTMSVGLLGSVRAPFRKNANDRVSESPGARRLWNRSDEERFEQLQYLLDRANRLAHELRRGEQGDLFNGDRRPFRARS